MANYKRPVCGVRLLCVLIAVTAAAPLEDYDDSYYDQRQISPVNFAGNLHNLIVAVMTTNDSDSEYEDALEQLNDTQKSKPDLDITLLNTDSRQPNAQAPENPHKSLGDVTLNPKTRELENEVDQKQYIDTKLKKMLVKMPVPFIRIRGTQ